MIPRKGSELSEGRWRIHICRQTSNISRTLASNTIFAHSEVVGASPVGIFILDLTPGVNETSLTDTDATRRLVANQREVMTRLLELLYVLNIKRNIF